MKIRECLVSNSSSSSFLVGFPHRPKNVLEVLSFMFDEKDYTKSTRLDYDEDHIKNIDIAQRVFDDIEARKKKLTIKEMVEVMMNRYYLVRGNSFMFGDNGLYQGWMNKDKWYGVNKDLLAKLSDLILKEDEERKLYYKQECDLFKKSGLVRPAYKTQAEETEKDKQMLKKFYKDYEEWKENNKEYCLFKKTFNERSNAFYKQIEALKRKVATIDAKAFIKDNNGFFIALFEYGDDNGSFEATMEHGNIFSKLPHITISNH